MASKCPRERIRRMSLILNQKLETIKLSEEGMEFTPGEDTIKVVEMTRI